VLEDIPIGLNHSLVMPALAAGIHVFWASNEDVDGREKPGHAGGCGST
jgi:hypothetical protein